MSRVKHPSSGILISSEKAMIKVLIADDHAIVRQGLKQILSEVPDMAVEGEAADTQEVMGKILAKDWDVLILDISMPGRSGLDVLKDVTLKKPKLPILVLSIHPEVQYALRVLKAGASGYMTKESAPDELVEAIRKVYRGGKFVSQSLAERLAGDLERDTNRAPHETLSDREYEVMCMIASGKTVKQIAQYLSLSVKTISTYRTRILQKMGMKTNAELTHYAFQTRLVD